jgi:F0F1-type ATP synthase assembly protein I
VGGGMVDNTDGEMDKVRRATKVMAVPWLMALAVVGFFFLGHYIDQHFGTGPYATIGLLVFSVIAGGYQSYRVFMRALKD